MGAHASNLIADQMLQDVLESEEQNPKELLDEADRVAKYNGAVDYDKLRTFFEQEDEEDEQRTMALLALVNLIAQKEESNRNIRLQDEFPRKKKRVVDKNMNFYIDPWTHQQRPLVSM